MSIQEAGRTVKHPVPVQIPDERDYSNPEDAELDKALSNSIDQAEGAEKDYLAKLLANELGSHYYSTR